MKTPDQQLSQRAPGFRAAVVRGIQLRCPMCGHGRLFRGLIRMHPDCSHCGFVFERGPGYFLGSTYINYGLTAGITTWSYVVLHFLLRFSNRAVMPGLLAFCAFFPVFFFRYARSLWLALDCFLDRVGAEVASGYADMGVPGPESETRQEIFDAAIDTGVHDVTLPRSPENQATQSQRRNVVR